MVPGWINFDELIMRLLRFWHFTAFLPEDYIKREKLKGLRYKMVVALHFCVLALFSPPYLYLFIVMLWNAEFNTELTCAFLIISSITIRFVLLVHRRYQFAGLIDECRQLYSYLQEDEIAILKYYEKIVNFFVTYCLITGYASAFTMLTFAYFIQFQDDDGNMYRKTAVRFV